MTEMSREDRELLEYAERQHAEGKLTDEELAATRADIESEPTPEPPRRARRRSWWPLVVLVAGGLVLAAYLSANGTPRLAKAAEVCELPSLLVVQDDGKSLTMAGGGEDSLFKVEDIACILRETGAPSHVITHMSSTRALDGQQTAEWDGLSARWTYHPEPGFQLILVEQ